MVSTSAVGSDALFINSQASGAATNYYDYGSTSCIILKKSSMSQLLFNNNYFYEGTEKNIYGDAEGEGGVLLRKFDLTSSDFLFNSAL